MSKSSEKKWPIYDARQSVSKRIDALDFNLLGVIKGCYLVPAWGVLFLASLAEGKIKGESGGYYFESSGEDD